MRVPNDPQAEAAKFLQNKDAMQALLTSPDTRKLLQALRQKDPSKLQNAAKAAMQGDARGLNALMEELSAQPGTADAAENLSKKLSE